MKENETMEVVRIHDQKNKTKTKTIKTKNQKKIKQKKVVQISDGWELSRKRKREDEGMSAPKAEECEESQF